MFYVIKVGVKLLLCLFYGGTLGPGIPLPNPHPIFCSGADMRRFDPRPNLMTLGRPVLKRPSLPDPDLGMSQISSSSGNLTKKSGTLMRCAKFGEFRRWTSLFPRSIA